jgi:hypothetical protein
MTNPDAPANEEAALRRHYDLVDDIVNAYRAGTVTLNGLILRLESLDAAIGLETWTQWWRSVFETMEQINALCLSDGRKMTPDEHSEVQQCLSIIESKVFDFRDLLDCSEDI